MRSREEKSFTTTLAKDDKTKTGNIGCCREALEFIHRQPVDGEGRVCVSYFGHFTYHTNNVLRVVS